MIAANGSTPGVAVAVAVVGFVIGPGFLIVNDGAGVGVGAGVGAELGAPRRAPRAAAGGCRTRPQKGQARQAGRSGLEHTAQGSRSRVVQLGQTRYSSSAGIPHSWQTGRFCRSARSASS